MASSRRPTSVSPGIDRADFVRGQPSLVCKFAVIAGRIPWRHPPLADHFYIMEHGKVVKEFAQRELSANTAMLQDYLGV